MRQSLPRGYFVPILLSAVLEHSVKRLRINTGDSLSERLIFVNKIAAVRNLLLALLLIGGAGVRANAQGVPALEDIKNQEELDKAVAVLDTAFLTPTTIAIWRSFHRSSWTMSSSTTIRVG